MGKYRIIGTATVHGLSSLNREIGEPWRRESRLILPIVWTNADILHVACKKICKMLFKPAIRYLNALSAVFGLSGILIFPRLQ